MSQQLQQMAPRLSIIIPSYKEVGNVRPLVEQLSAALKEAKLRESSEIIYVDDNSNDGTEDEVKKLSREGHPVRIIVRRNERGLSSAVLRGFAEAQGQILLCMDADLQHPPTAVPKMYKELTSFSSSSSAPEFVIGTRYGSDTFAVDKEWAIHRVIMSKGARALARPLTPLSDPMTGFFAITRAAYERGLPKVNPIGFKIAMEMYVKSGIKKHAEVPIFFGVRQFGHSKLSSKVIINYVSHLRQLYVYRFPYLPILLLLLIVLIFVVFFKLVLKR